MRDRQPLFPGRVKMLPVAGQENVFDMVMADEPTEEGTPPIKKNLLTDLTASLYGLPNPTVNDLLGVLSGAAMVKKTPKYTEVSVNLATAAAGTEIWIGEGATAAKYIIVKTNYEGSGAVIAMRSASYASKQWNSTGVNTYSGSTIDVSCADLFSTFSNATKNASVAVNVPYTIGGGNTALSSLNRTCFIPSLSEMGYSDANANVEGSSFDYLIKAILWTRTPVRTNATNAYLTTATLAQNSIASALTSFYPCVAFSPTATITWYTDGTNTYPEQAYTYAAATVLGEIIGGFPRVETGEYTGTGTFGAGNPTRIEVGFRPKLALIGRDAVGILPYSGYWSVGVLWIEGIEATTTAGVSSQARFTQGDTYLSIHSLENANAQLNTSGAKFVYAIVG